MRLYKIFSHYIDLDHVLTVSEVYDAMDCGDFEFNIQLAFQTKLKFINYCARIPDGIYGKVDFNELLEEVKSNERAYFSDIHRRFIEAWSNKTKGDKNKIQSFSGSGFVSNGIKLVHDGKYLYAVGKDGQPFPNQISCTIKDYVNQPTIAIIKAHVQSIEYQEKV